jgi:hypothetical protein
VKGCALLGASVAFLVLAVASGSSQVNPWAALHRPFHIPRLKAGQSCPRTLGRPAHDLSPDFGIANALGDRPVYPVFDLDYVYDPSSSARSGSVHFGNAGFVRGWYGIKVLWIAAPTYSGRVLVRGRRTDRRIRLRFGGGRRLPLELRIPALRGSGVAGAWHFRPSLIRIKAPGCYGFQIDGTDFSDVVLFRASRR